MFPYYRIVYQVCQCSDRSVLAEFATREDAVADRRAREESGVETYLNPVTRYV